MPTTSNPCNYNPIDEMSLRRINAIFKDIHLRVCYLQAQLDLREVASGEFRLSFGDAICITQSTTLYFVAVYTLGTPMFYDIELTQPVLDYPFIAGEDNIIRDLDPLTGIVGAAVGTC